MNRSAHKKKFKLILKNNGLKIRWILKNKKVVNPKDKVFPKNSFREEYVGH